MYMYIFDLDILLFLRLLRDKNLLGFIVYGRFDFFNFFFGGG